MSQILFIALRILLYVAWSCVLTWPLASAFSSKFPLGIEFTRAVPQLNMWTIWWNADRLQHGWSGYWAAPIFHPYPDAFALSEPQPITMLLAPLVWLFPASAVPYNVYFLISLTLNGLLAELVLREMKVAAVPAIFGGLLMAALPFVHWQRDAIQLVPIWGILWFWLALARFAVKPILGRSLVVGLAFSSVVLSCLHYSLFLAMLSCAACWWLVSDRLTNWRFWAGLFAAALVALLLSGPFVLRQVQVLRSDEWHRDTNLVESLSAWPRDYLWVWNASWHGAPPIDAPERGYWNMSPGWMALALAFTGLGIHCGRWFRFRYLIPFAEIIDEESIPPAAETAFAVDEQEDRAHDDKPRSATRWLGLLTTVAVVSLILSCGTHLRWDGVDLQKAPSTLLRCVCAHFQCGAFDLHQAFVDILPGYRQLRSPFRFGLFVQLAVLLLAAVGADFLWKWCVGSWRQVGSEMRSIPRWHIIRELMWGVSLTAIIFMLSKGLLAWEHYLMTDLYVLAAFALIAAVGIDMVRMLCVDGWRRYRAIRSTSTITPIRIALWVSVAALCIVEMTLFEVGPRAVPLHAIPDSGNKSRLQPLWVDWLNANAGSNDVVAHLPFPDGASVYAYEPTTDAMFWQTRYRRPMVNGYSGFFPQKFIDLRDACIDFPSPASLEALKSSDVRWCLIQRSGYEWQVPQPFNVSGLKWVYFDEPAGIDVYLLE